MEEIKSHDVDEKYQIKSEIDHVLDRSGLWIGSINTEVMKYPLFIPSKNKIQILDNIGVNYGLLKLVDEVLSNSIDEHRRKDALFKITEINVDINTNGKISISDNGGIPVRMHKGAGVLVPELIFGHLRTSSNYDDTQEREVVGTNGLGAKLTNIFSKRFEVQTCDTKKSVHIVWENNMRESSKDLEKYPKEGFLVVDEGGKDLDNHGTKISFELELERFELPEIPLQTIRVLQKRCIDAAAANPGLIINFNSNVVDGKLNSTWQFNSFKEYVELYLDENQKNITIDYINKRDSIVIIQENINLDFAFVNGAVCSEGTHMKKVQSQIVSSILDYCVKNDMELITEKDITSRMSIFINTSIINPTYDSQSKTKLTNKLDKYALAFSQEFLDNLKNTEIVRALKDYYEIKYAEVKKKELRALNNSIKTTKIKKLISCASKDKNSNELWIFEGTSASNGFRKQRNLFQSAYLLRGKIKNTFNLNRSQILENQELREIVAAVGLLFNEPKANLKNCNYSKIIFATDMDHDGNHICGLLIAFFAKHFPELFKAGKICRALSPIIIASKGKSKKYYITLEDFEREEHLLKGYEMIYTKGLGGLADEDYRQMLRNKKLLQFTLNDVDDMESINVWFNKSTTQRKELLLIDTQKELIED